MANLAGRRWRFAATTIASAGIIAQIALVNADVFGYPWLYYLFYYQHLNPSNF